MAAICAFGKSLRVGSKGSPCSKLSSARSSPPPSAIEHITDGKPKPPQCRQWPNFVGTSSVRFRSILRPFRRQISPLAERQIVARVPSDAYGIRRPKRAGPYRWTAAVSDARLENTHSYPAKRFARFWSAGRCPAGRRGKGSPQNDQESIDPLRCGKLHIALKFSFYMPIFPA